MRLSLEACYEILLKNQLPPHIVRHSEKVALISNLLGCALILKGETLDIEILTFAALLHDVKKYESIVKGIDHAEEGYSYLCELGYKRIAEIVRAHIYLPDSTLLKEVVTEEEVVFYADKRVMHESIVSIEERFEDLRKRYGKTKERIERLNKLEKFSKLLEAKIFKKLDFSPDVLKRLEDVKEAKDVLKRGIEDCTDCWRDILRKGSSP